MAEQPRKILCCNQCGTPIAEIDAQGNIVLAAKHHGETHKTIITRLDKKPITPNT